MRTWQKINDVKFFKRLFSILLAAVIIIGTCCSCEHEYDESNTPETLSGEDYPNVVIAMPISWNASGASIIDDGDEIASEINKITTERYGISTSIEWIDSPYEQNQFVKLSSGKKLDIMYVHISINNMYESGYMMPLNELINEYGSGIREHISDELLELGSIGDTIYCVPSCKDYTRSYGFCMRKDILEKYGFKASDIKTFDDMEAVFETVHNNEPELITLAPMYTHYSCILTPDNIDMLGDSIGVLDNDSDGMTVINYFETREYQSQIYRIREWYLKGYLPEDVMELNYSSTELFRQGKLFCCTAFMKPGYASQESTTAGYDMAVVDIYKPLICTRTGTAAQWFINNQSSNPENAMVILNALFSDVDIQNLICWGIEGKHYVVRDDGFIDYPKGVNRSNTSYFYYGKWILPNSLSCYQWVGGERDLEDKMESFNEESRRSRAYGFVFDSSKVSEEYNAVREIYYAYNSLLGYGIVDTDKILPEFLDELEKAGIDTVIAEKQRQLNEWYELNK